VVGVLVGFRVGRLWTVKDRASMLKHLNSDKGGADCTDAGDVNDKAIFWPQWEDRNGKSYSSAGYAYQTTANAAAGGYGSLKTEDDDQTDESEREIFFSSRSASRLKEIFSQEK